jgi:hypothetical protein
MWHYKQNTGRLYDNTNKLIAIGYAGGNCGKNREGINNHLMQDKPNIGPLPVGTYTMMEVEEGHPTGPFTIVLQPDSTNIMYGRGGFRIHGDTVIRQSASEGCIVLARPIREQMWDSSDHQVIVEIEV